MSPREAWRLVRLRWWLLVMDVAAHLGGFHRRSHEWPGRLYDLALARASTAAYEVTR